MKRFVWRLQHVLDIRAKQEQIKRAELLEITERLAQTRGELLSQQRILKDIISGIAAKKPHKRLPEQEFFFKNSAVSEEQIKKLKRMVSKLESQQLKKMGEVLKVRRFKEGLERLRAQAKEEFVKEQEKLEQKRLDEAASISFARNRDPALQCGGKKLGEQGSE
ncbi:MAG: flagellar export protein FliJ [Planctomycetota bacterium]|jgi:flagellar biosynthesis chaperone FliJ